MAEFKTSSETLTKELKADKEKELNEKYAELNALSDKYWKEFTKARDESFVAFKKKFAVVIQELVAAKKIDFILDKEAFIYYPAKMDLTDEVIKTYNKKYPVAKESK
jgi:Skp family chaperone for outer membrane proteins